MGLTTVSTGATIRAVDFDQFYNVLQQPSGGQEAGHYFLADNSYASGGTISLYLPSLSRTSSPVSVSIDSSDTAPSGITSVTTNNLTSGGFQVNSASTAITTNAIVGGKYTIQF